MLSTTTSKVPRRPALSLPSMAKTVELRVWRTSGSGAMAAVSTFDGCDDPLADLDGAVGRRGAGRGDEHGHAGIGLEQAEEPGDAVPPTGASVVGAIAAPQPAERTTAASLFFLHEAAVCRGLRVGADDPRQHKADGEGASGVQGKVGDQILRHVSAPTWRPGDLWRGVGWQRVVLREVARRVCLAPRSVKS